MDAERNATYGEAHIRGSAGGGILLTSKPPESPRMFIFSAEAQILTCGLGVNGEPVVTAGDLCGGANDAGAGIGYPRSPVLALNLEVGNDSLDLVFRDLMNRVLKKLSTKGAQP